MTEQPSVPHRHGPTPHDDHTTTFRLWAPHAERVALLTGGHEIAMAGAQGWFAARAEAAHGHDYRFRLDGGAPRPDPAARWLPHGVHEAARVLDPRRFAWTDAGWRAPPVSAAVVYELHIGTFTAAGTFDAAIPRLPALAALGATHVEVMPVNAFNGERGWGYDGVAWWAVHEPYGGPAGFARFVDAAHGAGLAVTLDVVFNHLGPSGNYLPEFGPYLTDHYATPWGDALNLDGPHSDPVRAFILECARSWLLDYHVDALRLDAVHGLVDTSAVHILAELAATAEAVEVATGRPRQLIAESDRCDPATVRPPEAGGMGMHAQWSDDLHHAIHTAVTGEREGYYIDYAGLPDVAQAYRRGFLFDGRYSQYRQRTVGAPLGDVPGHRLVTCVQNHDQVGNRAAGERLTTLVEPALVRVAILLLCASPTTPMLFMGEEYGETRPFQYFTSHPEPELAAAVRTGRAEEFTAFAAFSGVDVPDPQDPATRDASVLDWSAAETPEGASRRALWAELLRLRREHPALGNGRRDLVEVAGAPNAHQLSLRRGDPRGAPVLLAANLSASPARIAAPPGRWPLLVSTDAPRYGGAGGEVSAGDGVLTLPPHSAALWAGPDGR
ncbi:MAG: malto-oligosyltrehalose trehalohydrolase [Egibacteraceae bacterium]